MIMGIPAEMYTAGTQFFVFTGGMVLAVIIAALVFVPLLYPLKLTSSFEVRMVKDGNGGIRLGMCVCVFVCVCVCVCVCV